MASILEFISNEPKYRKDQLCRAWFDLKIKGYDEISTFPSALREKLKTFPWLAARPSKILKSKIDETVKALLELEDGLFIETVLMSREGREKKARQNFGGQNLSGYEDAENLRRTICISSQVGCAMGCLFCATGRLGFKRNLSVEEIISQYRFWQDYLAGKGEIQNIVVMGQGEPLLNYKNVKTALNIILKNTAVGPSKITVSTAGIIDGMEQILSDPEFPPVRIAISLHSAIEETRKKIMPAHTKEFLIFLPKWAKKYHQKFKSRSHFLGLEYVMLKNLNDDEKHLRALITLASKLGSVKMNLMPWNELPFTASANMPFAGSSEAVIKHWQDKLMQKGFICTIRHSQGADISAACGQLNVEYRK